LHKLKDDQELYLNVNNTLYRCKITYHTAISRLKTNNPDGDVQIRHHIRHKCSFAEKSATNPYNPRTADDYIIFRIPISVS